MTQGGGFEAVEGPDGRTLYYAKTFTNTPGVWRIPVGGGQETPAIDTARSGHWAVTDRGIYFVDFSTVPTAAPKPVKFFSFEIRKIEQICTIDRINLSSNVSFSVSRDGRWVLWCHVDRNESNLMLIDNFR